VCELDSCQIEDLFGIGNKDHRRVR
jgi:hypothetical protein